MLPDEIYYTTITDEDGKRLGFGFEELAEFDVVSDLDLLDDALEFVGIRPIRVGYGSVLVETLIERRPFLLWNLNGGLWGRTREAQVPVICEMLGISLVGSGPWTAFMSQDKVLGKHLVGGSVPGILTAHSIAIESRNDLGLLAQLDEDKRYIVKPRTEGSSRGIDDTSVRQSRTAIGEKVESVLEEWGPVMVEEFIEGLDISADLASDDNGNLVPMVPIFTGAKGGIQTALHKTTAETGPVLDMIPPDAIDETLRSRVRRMALQIAQRFRARHYFRIDLRYERTTGNIFFLEANVTPTFAIDDNYVVAANYCGLTFPKLIRNVVSAAYCDAVSNVRLNVAR